MWAVLELLKYMIQMFAAVICSNHMADFADVVMLLKFFN